MIFLSGIDWLSNKLFGTKRKIIKATVRSMFTTSLYDASKIKNELGFQFISTEKTLERVVKESGKGSN